MPNHTKPTPEELEANINKAIEELDKVDEQTPTDTQEDIIEDTPEDTTEADTQEDEQGEIAEEDITTPEDTQENTQPEEDEALKKKLAASARENQKILAKNRKINQAISDAGEIPEPTEEELEAEYEGWDVMSTTEQKIAKESLINKRRFDIMYKGIEESKKIEKWNEQVEEFIGDPKVLADIPELDGKEEEFKLFANNPEYHGTSFKLLVPAFLHDQAKNAKPKSKGKMFETGTGGSKEKIKPKSDILSLAEGQALKERDYKAYTEKLKAGKIASE